MIFTPTAIVPTPNRSDQPRRPTSTGPAGRASAPGRTGPVRGVTGRLADAAPVAREGILRCRRRSVVQPEPGGVERVGHQPARGGGGKLPTGQFPGRPRPRPHLRSPSSAARLSKSSPNLYGQRKLTTLFPPAGLNSSLSYRVYSKMSVELLGPASSRGSIDTLSEFIKPPYPYVVGYPRTTGT